MDFPPREAHLEQEELFWWAFFDVNAVALEWVGRRALLFINFIVEFYLVGYYFVLLYFCICLVGLVQLQQTKIWKKWE